MTLETHELHLWEIKSNKIKSNKIKRTLEKHLKNNTHNY